MRGGNNHVVAWAPDGKHLAYASDRDGQSNLYFEPMDRSRPARRLTIGEYHQDPISFSPDGRLLTYWDNPPETGQDIWLYSFDGDGSAEPLLVTPANETCAAFSPDGRLLVYSSDESGRSEIYIQPFPGPGERIQVSVEGGREPVWGPGGNEVFFWSVPDTSLLVADISVGSDVTVSIPRILFSARFRRHEAGVPNYAISPDGSRFIMIQPGEEARLSYPLTLVLNWQREFEDAFVCAKLGPDRGPAGCSPSSSATISCAIAALACSSPLHSQTIGGSGAWPCNSRSRWRNAAVGAAISSSPWRAWAAASDRSDVQRSSGGSSVSGR